MAKSKASSKLLSKISSTQAEIKPKLVELASKYDQVLTDFDYVIGNWKGQGRLLRSDNEYVGAVKRAFKAISTGTECEDVEVHGHGTHLAHLPDPYKMLHTTFCGKQGKHFMDMLDHYCANNIGLKSALTTFVKDLSEALQPFVSELHTCKVSHTREGLNMEFSSNRVAYNMIKYYKIMAGEKDPLKIVFDSETDPLKQKGSSIVIRHSKGQGDVGVFKGGDKEIAVCLPTQQERDAFQHLFDGSSDP